jgi:tRNA G26 N,N-dimethylase Trm1
MQRHVREVEMPVVPSEWLREGLDEGGLHEVVARSLATYTAVSVVQQEAVVEGLMAYLSDYLVRVRAQANENTALKLRGADRETIARSTTQSLIEELHARGGRHADEDSVVLFALTGALLRTLPVEALRATG